MRFFYLYPILELLAYGLFISLFGLSAALLFGLVSFLVGLSILRGRGLTLLSQEMRSRNIASFKVFNLSMFAGILLVIPGFITNFIGALLLIPAVFQLLASRYGAKSTSTHANAEHSESELHEGTVVDGEYHVVDKKENAK